MRLIIALLLTALLTTQSVAGIKAETVIYKSGGVTLKGYAAFDESRKGKLPVILVVHEWWGLNDYAKMRAEKLAALGYLAFAVDMYGDGKTVTQPADAGKLAGEIKGNESLMRQRITDALSFIKTHPLADTGKIAAIGYCFGGTVALELARSGADIRGVVAFHAGLSTKHPENTKNVKAKILVCHGAADTYVPQEEVAAFCKEMDDAGADWQFNSYAYAVHAFTNPNSGNKPENGVAYNEKADKRSWIAMQQFFYEIFK